MSDETVIEQQNRHLKPQEKRLTEQQRQLELLIQKMQGN